MKKSRKNKNNQSLIIDIILEEIQKRSIMFYEIRDMGEDLIFKMNASKLVKGKTK